MGTLQVVVGGQYGSEGKGAITGWLGRKTADAGGECVGVRVAGPNAGHTVWGSADLRVVDAEQREWKLRSVPVLAVTNPDAPLLIAAGSEVDYSVLNAEVAELDAAGYNVSQRLSIDAQATELTPTHIELEQLGKLTDKLGSTAKGIGAARSERIWRTAGIVGSGIDGAAWLHQNLKYGRDVIIEGTQGYGLGLHAGEYPFCTSSDCRAIDFLGMAGVSPWHPVVDELEVWVVLRTRPIRVAGNSGRLESETSWEEIGLPEERTTVTNKVRRVGEWDADLAARAVQANGGQEVMVALTMLDQMFPEVKGAVDVAQLSADALNWVNAREDEIGARIWAVGTSPTTVVEL